MKPQGFKASRHYLSIKSPPIPRPVAERLATVGTHLVCVVFGLALGWCACGLRCHVNLSKTCFARALLAERRKRSRAKGRGWGDENDEDKEGEEEESLGPGPTELLGVCGQQKEVLVRSLGPGNLRRSYWGSLGPAPAPVAPTNICRRTVFRSLCYMLKYKHISFY